MIYKKKLLESGDSCLKSLSILLGKQEYFYGDLPSSLDGMVK
jgi:hypothetical protein